MDMRCCCFPCAAAIFACACCEENEYSGSTLEAYAEDAGDGDRRDRMELAMDDTNEGCRVEVNALAV